MQVFISYANSDAELVRKISDAVQSAGFQVWDGTQIFLGDNWAQQVAQGLEESTAMIVLLTPDSLHARNVELDVSFALGKIEYKGRLIPVIAASEEQLPLDQIPWILKKLQVLRIPNLKDNREGLEQITQALQAAAQTAA